MVKNRGGENGMIFLGGENGISRQLRRQFYLEFRKSHSITSACSICSINVIIMEYLYVMESQFKDSRKLTVLEFRL